MERSRTIAILKAIFAVTAWGGSFIATKFALRDVMPITVVWLRFAIGVVILGLAVIFRKQMALPGRQNLGYFALLGFLGITFHQWLQSNALLTSLATTTAWIVATTPVFMALLGWLILRESLRWAQVWGILLAALGVLLVVTQGNLASLAAGRFGVRGDFLVLLSAPNWAIFSTLSRRGLSEHPAARMMLFVMGFGWLFASLLFFLGPGWEDIGRLTFEGWLGILFLGVACSGLAYIFWYDALKILSTAQTGAFLYLEPFVTLIVAAVLLGESILWSSLFGGAAILVGVWMVNRKRG